MERASRIVLELRSKTDAGRTTLRLELEPGDGFPIVAESTADGVKSLRGGDVGDLHRAPTVRRLDRDRSLLIQPDLRDADPAPPADLVSRYGAKAQMLAPLGSEDGRLVGIVSVHEVRGPRDWSPADVAALKVAVRELAAITNTIGDG